MNLIKETEKACGAVGEDHSATSELCNRGAWRWPVIVMITDVEYRLFGQRV